jgi:hypothetical protein
MTMSTVDKLIKINTRITGIPRVFSSAFDGMWGGEDDFVGLIAMLYNIPVVAIDPTHFIRHIYHVSKSSEDFMQNAHLQYAKLKKLATEDNAPGLNNMYFNTTKVTMDDFLAKVASFRVK